MPAAPWIALPARQGGTPAVRGTRLAAAKVLLPASERAEYDACLALAAAHLSAEHYTQLWERERHP